MKTRVLFLFACLGAFYAAMAQTTEINLTNEKWNKVEQLEKQSLPQSALEIVNQIRQEALKEGNSPELIKSLIYQLKYETTIDRDKLPDMIKDLEQFTQTNSHAVEQALLYSVIAELYAQYYQDNSYSIHQRTALIGDIPEDIREWSPNLFIQRIADYVTLSLRNANELQRTNVSDYKAILTEGNASRNLRPSLYDFLAYRGIELLKSRPTMAQYYFPQTKLSGKENFAPAREFIQLPISAEAYDFVPQILKIYRDLLTFRLKENNLNALIITDLDRLEFVWNNTQTDGASANYLDALFQLKEQYANRDFCAEIIYKEASFYITQPHRYPLELNDLQNENIRKAYYLCTEGIERYAGYERIGLLRNLLNTIIEKQLTTEAAAVAYPGKNLDIKIHYRNVDKLIVQIYKINNSLLSSVYYGLRSENYLANGKLIHTQEVKLINDYPYIFSDTVIKIPVNELGVYEYVIYADSISKEELPANQPFSVSRITSLSRVVAGQREFLVTDRLSGKPLEGAKIDFYRNKDNSSQWIDGKTVFTDKQGLVLSPGDNNSLYYKVSYGNDTLKPVSPTPWISSYKEPNTVRVNLNLFTDRSIYRPGQTVHFKGIAYSTDKKDSQAISGKKYTLTLRDANYKEIANKNVTTNEFGSFSGEFQLPQNVLPGYFTLQSDIDNGTVFIRVEEYKRPTFDIQFAENDKIYRLGDQVIVAGNVRTFSGVAVQNVTLQYRITRRNHWLFRWIRRDPVQIAAGTVQMKDDGNFEIAFIADCAFEDRKQKNVFYTYTLEASVTAINGETQQTQTDIHIGDRSAYLILNNWNRTISKEDFPALTIQAKNLGKRPVRVKGNYVIYRLKPNSPEKLSSDLQSNDWLIDKEIIAGDFESGKEIAIAGLKSHPSGRYRIKAKAKDAEGRDIEEAQTDFTLTSTKDKRPPIPVYEWLMTPKTTCETGGTAEIIYGSSAKNVHVLYEIFRKGEKLSASRFVLNNENKKITIPFLESHGSEITVCFTFIKDSQVFTKEVTIYKKQPDKGLILNMEVFRDRLRPGQQEEWKISVKDAEKNPVLSELMATMYDASLDKITEPWSWFFNPFLRSYSWRPVFNQGNEFLVLSSMFQTKRTYSLKIPEFNFDQLNWFGWDIYDQSLKQAIFNHVPGQRVFIEPQQKSTAALAEVAGNVETADPTDRQASLKEVGPEASSSTVQIRRNFNETAFFYPQLKTDAAGETLISFTIPESNTTWKFMGLAHTKDLKYGQIVKEIISQKQLMVTPNVPRFFREGDKASISSTLSSLSDSVVAGEISIECFDPVSGQSNILIPENTKPFRLDAGKTVAVSWNFDIPSGIELTTLKIVARANSFSDGEQHLVPVLSNRMLVTESLPLNVQGGQTRTFSFDKITKNHSSSKENFRLTLEFASNPVWYAVQALPALTTPESDNVLSWFAACYSNALATHIANNTPKIKEIIAIWTKQGETKETLRSNLAKNQALKAVLLEETPWLLEAQNETEQQQRLALLFDINKANYLNSQAIGKLRSLQTAEGGWAWFKGMPSNVSITQWILYGMGRLAQLGAMPPNDEIKEMQRQAIRFIDKQFKKQYDDFKKYNTDWKQRKTVSTYELEYLLVRSFYKEIPLDETEEAFQFFSGLTGKYWANDARLYERALAALILQRNGNEKTALSVVASLREHASHKPDFGMFWANNSAQTFLFQSAICVHTFIMEAFYAVGSKPEEMDEMKRWLLKQKQTQAWESVPATVNAVNALLQTGTQWLENEGKTTLRLGETTIDAGRGEAGTGYVKTIFDAKDITPDKSRITIAKEDAGPGWGALYWQYFEKPDKVTAAKTELNVEKSLFVEKSTVSGKTLIPVSVNNPLQIGDKVVVRLVVRTDRDMEYVLLKDMRASCFEPAEQLSGIRWMQGVVYYQTVRDASMNFYFNHLPKGTYVFEYPLYANAFGDYSNGIATIQCLYAPEFVSHTSGERVAVEAK